MEIAVDGWRASAGDWEAVRQIPRDQLPPLTAEQREVARKLGVPEDEYARSALAGERGREVLLHKAERLARVIEEQAKTAGTDASVERIILRTVESRFDVDLRLNGRSIPLRIAEDLVDDYFDSGSTDAEQRLGRVVKNALQALAQ